MALIDLLIILAFIAYAIGSGLKSKDVAGQNLEEYFLAGRSLPGWKAGISMAATQFAADTPLMVTGLLATAGIFSLWRLWIYAVAFLLMGFVLAASWRRATVITDAELTEVRYGEKGAAILRGVKAIYFGTVFNCMVLGFVLLAATRIAEPFLTWHEWTWFPSWLHGAFESLVRSLDLQLTADLASPDVYARSASNLISILAIVIVTTFYSTTGGLRSVVNTDVMQFFLMIIGTLLFAWVVVDKVGGLGAIPDALRERYGENGLGGMSVDEMLAFTPTVAKDAGLAILVLFAIQWFAQMNADGTGYLAQRSMACRSDTEAKKAALWFTFMQIIVRSLMWLPLGFGLLLLFPPAAELSGDALRIDREYTFVLGLADLPPGIKGLMVTGMLAALASTVDTHLNWGSSYWTNDIYKRFICQSWRKVEPDPRSLVWVARGANIFILLLGLTVMTQLGSIGAAWEKSLLLGAGMGGVLVLRWVWWRLTAWGELSAIVASLVLLPLLLWGFDASPTGDALKMIFMFAGSTAAGVVVSIITGPEKMERLEDFFRRAQPVGFWGPVAQRCGVDSQANQKRLWRGLAAVALSSLSFFCVLCGLGSLLIGSPPPVWLPVRPLWIGLLLATGFGLIPVWWRLGFGPGAESPPPPSTDARTESD